MAKAKEDERIVHLHFKVPEGEENDYPVAYLQTQLWPFVRLARPHRSLLGLQSEAVL